MGVKGAFRQVGVAPDRVTAFAYSLGDLIFVISFTVRVAPEPRVIGCDSMCSFVSVAGADREVFRGRCLLLLGSESWS